MKKIALILIAIAFIGCDDRAPGAYDSGEMSDALNVTTLNYNGIDYVHFENPTGEVNEGWSIDYSQFFKKDTLIIHGEVWVRVGTEIETIKEQKLPRVEE